MNLCAHDGILALLFAAILVAMFAPPGLRRGNAADTRSLSRRGLRKEGDRPEWRLRELVCLHDKLTDRRGAMAIAEQAA